MHNSRDFRQQPFCNINNCDFVSFSLQSNRTVMDTSPFDSAARIEEGQTVAENNPSSDSSTTDERYMSLSRRISELEDAARLSKIKPKVKVTPWRLLNCLLLLGLGIYKAAAGYLGEQSAVTTSDLFLGVLWALMWVSSSMDVAVISTCSIPTSAYWTSFLEEAELGPGGRWFFTHDVSMILRPLIFTVVFGFIICGFILGFIGEFDVHLSPASRSNRHYCSPSNNGGALFEIQTLVLIYLGFVFMMYCIARWMSSICIKDK